MNCDEVKMLKQAWLDGELDVAHSLEVEKHVNGCADCARSAANIRAMKSAIKNADVYFNAPTRLKRQIREATIGEPAPRRTQMSGGWLKFALPFAMAMLLALLIMPSLVRPSANGQLAEEVVSSHVRSMMANHLMDVPSTDQHTVKPWFDGKVDFAPPVVNLAEQGFPLTGGRLDYLQGRPVAALIYQRNKHIINVFIWPAKDAGQTDRKSETRQGYNLVHWTANGMAIWAVSDLNEHELRDFSELIK
jgi:anti-sigma factor RsiW